jgi:hypothetical protein
MRSVVRFMKGPGYLSLNLLIALVILGPIKADAQVCDRLMTEAEFARPLDETERRSVVEALASMLERLYLYPDKGKAMAAALRKRQAEGHYRALIDPKAFSQSLVADVRAISSDKHLQVRARIIQPEKPATGPESEEAIAARRERFRRGAAYDGFGIDTVRVLFGNVGYLKVREFWTPGVSGEKLAGAMAIISDSDAIIVDLRESYGGSEGVVALLMGYFLRNPALLFQTRNTLTDKTTQMWSAAFVPGTRIRSSIPVYVLTSSRRTFSAAEMLAISLRELRQAVVIGEKTRGGAHGGDFRPLSCRFDAFVPYYGSFIADRNETWEGVGIEPDVSVDAKSALVTAYKAALKKLLEQPDSANDQLAREIRQERTEKLRKLEAGEDP